MFGMDKNKDEKKVLLPDFNFPQDVIKDSEDQLKNALSHGDGVSTIDAIIKYSLAKSSLSDETFDEVITKIENVIKQEKKEDIKAILLLLESKICKSHEDFDKGETLYKESIKNASALKSHKIEEYPNIITSDELGRRLCPTLYDFLRYEEEGEYYLYSILEEGEMQGFRLKNLSASSYNYKEFVDYVKKYPNGIWTNDIKNHISYIEKQNVNVSYPEQVHSSDDVIINVKSENARNIKIHVYRFPDNRKYESYSRVSFSDLKEVLCQEVSFESDEYFFTDSKDINIGKLPLGRYHVQVEVNGSLKNEDAYPYKALRIQNTSDFTVNVADNEYLRIITVDTKTGERVSEQDKKKEYFRKPDYNAMEYVTVLTDLGIYRPGETLRYTVLCGEADLYKKHPLESRKFEISFFDSNHKLIETQTLYTDSYGQLQGKFDIPTDRTNGEFRIEAKDVTSGYTSASNTKYITVSEYKTPTFYVDLSDNETTFDKDKDIVLSGKCQTYSNIPVANRLVQVNVTGHTWFWRSYSNAGDTEIYVETNTDTNGNFKIVLESSRFSSESMMYEVSAKVTDEAGESQEGRFEFSIGKQRGLSFYGVHDICIDKPFNLPVSYVSSDPNDKVESFHYTLLNNKNGKIVKEATLSSDNTLVDFTDLVSGTYTLKANIENSDNNVEETIVLYRKNEKVCPTESALWLPSVEHYCDDNGLGHVLIGTAYHSHIYYLATSRTGVISQGWLDYQPGMHEFTIQVPDGENQHAYINFLCYYEGKLYSANSTVNYTKSNKTLTLQLESFRDKIVPGTKETWKFSLKDENGKLVGGRLALEVISEAVDQIKRNNWSYYVNLLNAQYSSLKGDKIGNNSEYGSYQDRIFNNTDYKLPSLYLYNRHFPWGASRRMYKYAMDGGMMALESAPMVMREADMSMDVAEVSTNSSNSSNKESFANINIRKDETKVALWEPMINVDKDGGVIVEFNVPQDNTTWRFNAFAFDDNLTSEYKFSKAIVASRAIMVKPSLPRFLRIGDKTTLMANIQNSSDEEVSADVLIELFDPRTDKILADTTLNISIAPNSMKAVGIPCEVNDNLSFIGFRIKAVSGESADGEQQMIPVLPAVIPVVETIPFYLNPTDGDTIINIDQFPKDAHISMEYCNNPVWYCLSALPTIYDAESKTASGLIHNLYAVTLAKGVSERNAMIAEALKKIQAENESLSFDEDTAKKIVKALCDLQNKDGGISWFDWEHRESSEYVTYEVLELLGELRYLGFEIKDSDILKLEKDALAYYEKQQLEHLEDLKKYAKESKTDVNYNYFDSYLYLRTLYPTEQYSISKSSKKLLKNTLESVEKNWREFSLPTRGFVALSLYRNDKVKTARLIMESMRQFAMKDARRGMFWDNLQTFGFRWYQRTALTALMLEAFNEVDPRAEEIDQIRKWMLLEKQTTDWGSSSMAAEATFALISTGSEWLVSSDCEYYKKDIDSTLLTSDNSIKISHNPGAPAWGAVYAKFPSVIKDTKAFKLDEIEITKELHKHDGGKIVDLSDIHVGDKLQVMLTINTDRDMQYVTIKDNRAACFEPVDKTSGYQFSDSNIKNRQSIGYYNDIKDTENRIMIYFLPKGSHVITYDVYVTNSGEFCTGLAEVTCEYAPQFTAHAAGDIISVK